MANTAVIDNLRRNIQNIGNVSIQQKIKELERKKEFQDSIKKSLVTSALSGRVRPKEGADFNNLDLDNPDFAQVLGKLGGLYEPQPAKVSSSYSISQVPFNDVMTAYGVLGAQGEDLVDKGLATKQPNIFGRKPGTGILGTGFGPGSEKAGYNISPEFESMKDEAARLIANPTRVTQRISGGQVLGGGGGTDSGMPDASQYEEGTTAEDENGQRWTVQNGEWVQA